MKCFAPAFVAALIVLCGTAGATSPSKPQSSPKAQASPKPQPSAKGSIRIGLLEPAMGPVAGEGADTDAGFRYFLATHGDRLGGFDVELRTGDEGMASDQALAVAHQLVEQDAVDAIVGVLNSTDAYTLAPYIDEQKKVLIVTGAGADGLTQQAPKTIFRVGHTSSQDVMPLGDYVCHRMRKRTAALVATDYSYGIEATGGFARAYTDAGCRVIQEIYSPRENVDWASTVAKIDKSAQIVFAAVGGLDSVNFLAAYRSAGPNVTLAGDGILTDERWLAVERDRATGVTTGLHYAATLNNAANKAFRFGYESLTGHQVSQFVENGYVAAQVLDAALGRMPPGTVKSDALVVALRGAAVTAPRGPVRFDRYQQAVNNVYVRRVRQIGGRFRNEVIETFPNVSQFWQYDAQGYLGLPTYARMKGAWARP